MSYIGQNRSLGEGMIPEYLLNMYVINPLYFKPVKSAIEVRFCTILYASPTNLVSLTSHLPHQTSTYTLKNQKLHQENHSMHLYQHIDKYIDLGWWFCIGTM